MTFLLLLTYLDLPVDQSLNGVLLSGSDSPTQVPLGFRSSLLFGRSGDETLYERV